MNGTKKRNLGEDIDTLRAIGKYYTGLPDATLHLCRGLGDGIEALEHRWEVTHDWEKYPAEEVENHESEN